MSCFSHFKRRYTNRTITVGASIVRSTNEAVFLPCQSPFACQAMNSLLDFYLSTVLPTAVAGVTEDNKDLKPHVESIQQIFDDLKRDVTKCVSSWHVLLLRENKDVNTACWYTLRKFSKSRKIFALVTDKMFICKVTVVYLNICVRTRTEFQH